MDEEIKEALRLESLWTEMERVTGEGSQDTEEAKADFFRYIDGLSREKAEQVARILVAEGSAMLARFN